MGACATKPADLKVEGDAPLVLDDAAEKKAGVVETDPAADGSRRRSLSELLKENADSDVEAPDEEEKKAEPAAAPADNTRATTELLTVQPSVTTTEQDHTGEELGAKAEQDPHTQAPVAEEEKRVDPDSVQVAAVPAQSVEESSVDPDAAQVAADPAPSVEESKVVADASV
ncbi:uncharacterized protein [Lolium perenne]|uniref:uncharacterized protein n=1 Tax=Lolium perenne TaxID=4522 RepID=UPI0021EA3B68|nr:uncharacterized protein LOC127330383 [Lolium perenne]